MTDPFYVSASGLSRFFTCPAQYDFHRRWSSKKPPMPWLADGIAVHGAMAGSVPDSELTTWQNSLVRKLRRLIDTQGYTRLLAAELRQELPLTRTIRLVRVIDALWLRPTGWPVIVDYKTASAAWLVVPGGDELVAPEATGFQAAAYLVPTHQPAPLEAWPTEMHFLVASSDDEKVHEVLHDAEAEDNLRRAAMVVRDAVMKQRFPKVRGYHCRYCVFQEMCFNATNWWTLFDQKENPHERTVLDGE